MPNYTPNYALPYPTLQEAPNGPAQMQALAEAVETQLGATSFRSGLSTARPAHREGLAFYETDNDVLVVSDGTTWREVWRATMPEARAALTADMGVPTGGNRVVTFNTLAYNSHPAMLNASGGIVIPRTGLYAIEAHIEFEAHANGYRLLDVQKNGSRIRGQRIMFGTALRTGFLQISGWERLNANDVIDLSVHQTSGVALTLYAASAILSVHMIRP